MDFLSKFFPAMQQQQMNAINALGNTFANSLTSLQTNILAQNTGPVDRSGDNSPGPSTAIAGRSHHGANASVSVDDVSSVRSSSRKRRRSRSRSSSSPSSVVSKSTPSHQDEVLSTTASNKLIDDILGRNEANPPAVTDPHQEIWGDLLHEYNDEESFGTEVSPPLASMAKLMWNKKLSTEKIKIRMDKVSIPSNCKFLSVKNCNKPIWSKADSKRSSDISLQKIQSALAKSQVHILNLADALTKAPKQGDLVVVDPAVILGQAKDALCLTGYTNQLLNQYRRSGLIFSMPANMRGLSKDVPEEDTLLFGDDLDKRIITLQAAEKTNKVFSNSSDHKQPRGFNNNYSNKYKNNTYNNSYKKNSQKWDSSKYKHKDSKNEKTSSKENNSPRRSGKTRRGGKYW